MFNYHSDGGVPVDDLVLTGTIALIGLFATVMLVVAGIIFLLLQVWQAAAEGNAGRVAAVLAVVLILVSAYAGTGLWLQKSGRI